jgi:hypothetical protein
MIKFKSGFKGYRKKLSLGDDIVVSIWGKILPNCRFIKVTPKGFNILNLDTDRTIFKNHLYMKGMGGKEFPESGLIRGRVLIPATVGIHVKKKERQA